jgi:hypothetical protein
LLLHSRQKRKDLWEKGAAASSGALISGEHYKTAYLNIRQSGLPFLHSAEYQDIQECAAALKGHLVEMNFLQTLK